MQELNDSEFQTYLETNPTCVIDIWAPWCGPCKALAPRLDEASQKHNSIPTAKINTDQNPEIIKELNVMSIPTLLFYKDGELQRRETGLLTPEQLDQYYQDIS